MHGGATAEQANPTPDEFAPLIKEEIEMRDMTGEKSKAPYDRRIGEIMLRAKSQMGEDEFQTWCENVTGKTWAECREYMSSAAKRRRP
jgi:hypothetical protein